MSTPLDLFPILAFIIKGGERAGREGGRGRGGKEEGGTKEESQLGGKEEGGRREGRGNEGWLARESKRCKVMRICRRR